MPNIAALLKDEISRVARKAVRSETFSLKKAVSAYRLEIAALKRRSRALEQDVHRLTTSMPRAQAAQSAAPAQDSRFSAKGLLSQRRRLGLSAADYGLLLGISSQTVYNWEGGKVRPRKEQMPVIAAIKKMAKKTVIARLAQLKQ